MYEMWSRRYGSFSTQRGPTCLLQGMLSWATTRTTPNLKQGLELPRKTMRPLDTFVMHYKNEFGQSSSQFPKTKLVLLHRVIKKVASYIVPWHWIIRMCSEFLPIRVSMIEAGELCHTMMAVHYFHFCDVSQNCRSRRSRIPMNLARCHGVASLHDCV
jgi:hypothetical protein